MTIIAVYTFRGRVYMTVMVITTIYSSIFTEAREGYKMEVITITVVLYLLHV